MRRNLGSFCCLVAIVLFIVLPGAWAEDEPAVPIAKIASPVFDFGSVSQGSKVLHEFEIENIGTAPLQIHRIVPACGCTASSMSSDVVEPGAIEKIKVEFDTTGFSGEKVKTVRLYTSDTKESASVLTLRGVVQPDVTVDPKRVFFGEVLQGEALAKEVTVAVEDGSSVKLTDLRSFSKSLVVEELESSSKKKKFRLTLSPEAKIGQLRDRIVIGLQGGKRKSINVPVFASIKGPIRLKPASVAFGVIEGKKPFTRSVKFENLAKEAVHIESVRSSHPGVSAVKKVIQEGKSYVIQVTVDPTKVSQDLRASVEITTDNDEQKMLSLSVYGVLPPRT